MDHAQTGNVVGVAATVSPGLFADRQGALEKSLGLVETILDQRVHSERAQGVAGRVMMGAETRSLVANARSRYGRASS